MKNGQCGFFFNTSNTARRFWKSDLDKEYQKTMLLLTVFIPNKKPCINHHSIIP